MMRKRRSITVQDAEAVLRHFFGKGATAIRQLHEGRANYVFEADVGDLELILRMTGKPSRLPYFMKEQWAVKKAREHGIPAPEILEVGNELTGDPFMICKRLSGVPATHHPDRLRILRELAAYAKTINSIPTSDYGHIFDWSRNKLSRNKTWAEFLDNELRVAECIALFRRHKMLTNANLRKLEAGVKELRKLKSQPTLNHGDVRLKNVLLDPKGRISALVDWEDCTSNAAPYWELSIALHDLSIDEKEAFLQGYGLSAAEYETIATGLKALNILNYSRAVAKALKNNDPETLDCLRNRLNGGFDLYSL